MSLTAYTSGGKAVDDSRIGFWDYLPDGFGDSDLAQAVLRILGTATARNWATATKLLSLCEEK